MSRAVCFAAVNGVELLVKPFGESYKPLGGAMVFTCELQLSDEEYENDGADVAYTIQWFDVDHNNQEITDKTGRLISFYFPIYFNAVCGLNSYS